MRSILLHVKNNEKIDDYINFEKNGYSSDKKYSKELRYMIKEFALNNWNVFLTSIDNFNIEKKSYERIYDLTNDINKSLSINEVDKLIDVMIIRVIGSVEGNFDNIHNYLCFVDENYTGLVLNNPKAMLRGMTKHYLNEIDSNYLKEININTIPSKIYPNTVNLNSLTKEYDNLSNYIIKPVSGELSNSLSNLANIDENFLRRKESKVKGWVVQPIMKEIYSGEYQMSFLNNNLIFSQKKEYTDCINKIPNQKNRILHKYSPSNEEIEISKKLIKYFENLYKIDINICRIDFMKNEENEPILLEFEMVNPGFFIGYMDKNDKDIKNITYEIRKYCEEYLNNKS